MFKVEEQVGKGDCIYESHPERNAEKAFMKADCHTFLFIKIDAYFECPKGLLSHL